MKRATTPKLVVLGCLMFAANAGFAQVTGTAPSFESLQAQLKAGERIEITQVSGKKITARLDSISGSVLTARAGRSTLAFQEGDIAQIRHRKPERWWDGMLIGMGVGAASGFISAQSMCRNDPECAAIVTAVFVPTFTGGGAAIGAIIDSLHHRNETVYERNGGSALHRLNVAPVAGKSTAGIRLSFSF